MQRTGLLHCLWILILSLPSLVFCGDEDSDHPLVTFRCDKVLAARVELEDDVMPWLLTWSVDQLEFDGAQVVDLTEKWCLTGPSFLGNMESTKGFSFIRPSRSKGTHPFDGLENFTTLLWWEKRFTHMDPLLSFGYRVWHKLEEFPELIPSYLREDFQLCTDFQWPDDQEGIADFWHATEHLRPFVESLQKPSPFVETLLQDKGLIDHILCLIFPNGCGSGFSRWEVDEKGRVQAFEWYRKNENPQTHQLVRYDRSSCLTIGAYNRTASQTEESQKFMICGREIGPWLLELPDHNDFATVFDFSDNPEEEKNTIRWMAYLFMSGFMPDLPLQY